MRNKTDFKRQAIEELLSGESLRLHSRLFYPLLSNHRGAVQYIAIFVELKEAGDE